MLHMGINLIETWHQSPRTIEIISISHTLEHATNREIILISSRAHIITRWIMILNNFRIIHLSMAANSSSPQQQQDWRRKKNKADFQFSSNLFTINKGSFGNLILTHIVCFFSLEISKLMKLITVKSVSFPRGIYMFFL